MTTVIEKQPALGNMGTHCFVCDVGITGLNYPLASCRTSPTRSPVVEKLGRLVGERYMVVISEDDKICRSCASLMNTLDRLETEMFSVRNVILRFLEKKYALEDGELINEKIGGVGLPPQITPSQQNPVLDPDRFGGTENFMARKRKAALAELEAERGASQDGLVDKMKGGDSKQNIWMQCDKCRYTTHYNAFMVHHIRQHVKCQGGECDYCGAEVKAGACVEHCSSGKLSPVEPDHVDPPEMVEMIATEVNNFTTTSEVVTPAMGAAPISEDMTIEVSQGTEPNPNTLCMLGEGDQQQLLTVQKMEDESNAVYVQVVEVGKEGGDPSNLTKQMLTVSEDGTVEMVEVMWDELVTPDVDNQQHMTF